MTEFEKAAKTSKNSTREWGVSEFLGRVAPLVPSPSRFRVNHQISKDVNALIDQFVDKDALSRLRSQSK